MVVVGGVQVVGCLVLGLLKAASEARGAGAVFPCFWLIMSTCTGGIVQ